MNLYSFLRGFSQCRRRIHSSTQMMSYIDSSKYRFFDFFLDWSPGSKNVPQACRDLPGRFATLPDPENRPKTSKNAILFENYFFNCWRQFLFLTAFKHYGRYMVNLGSLRHVPGMIWGSSGDRLGIKYRCLSFGEFFLIFLQEKLRKPNVFDPGL